MIWLFVVASAFASDLPGESIWTAPEEKVNLPKEERHTTEVKSELPKVKKTNTLVVRTTTSNLPQEYQKISSRESNQAELVLPKPGTGEIFRGIRVGDALNLSIPHSVIGFPDEKAPVVAIADSGALRGIRFIGESYLEKNTRRIFINFNRLVLGQTIYKFSGVAVSADGQPGLYGEYHSREAEYFTGDFIASFAAGYFDGLVPRRTNVFGQTEVDSSVDSAVKKGLASGALSTAERFKEKLKKVPEFSELKGPFEIKLLVLEPAINK